jgi:hypothetical protein
MGSDPFKEPGPASKAMASGYKGLFLIQNPKARKAQRVRLGQRPFVGP